MGEIGRDGFLGQRGPITRLYSRVLAVRIERERKQGGKKKKKEKISRPSDCVPSNAYIDTSKKGWGVRLALTAAKSATSATKGGGSGVEGGKDDVHERERNVGALVYLTV